MGEDFLLYYETTNHTGHHCSYFLFLMMLMSVLFKKHIFHKENTNGHSFMCVCIEIFSITKLLFSYH